MAEGPPYASAKDVPKGTPTPTQDELDRIKLGEHIEQLANDGSGPDPYDKANREAQQKAQGIKTREGHVTHTTQPRTTPVPPRTT
jgi:hypothetical protein